MLLRIRFNMKRRIFAFIAVGVAGTYVFRNQRVNPDILVCGGGTSGCIIAYSVAKWMDENKVPGKVVLLDSGNSFFSENGPNPQMSEWFNNWGNFSELHDTSAIDDQFFPSPGSTHIGIGGAGTHDTRITFMPNLDQRHRYSRMMDWSPQEFDMYLQAALNMIPLQSAGDGEHFYDEVIRVLKENTSLETFYNNDCKAQVRSESIAYASIAMFPDERRWTSAYLLHDSIRPKNLSIRTNVTVDRAVISRDACGSLKATGVIIRTADGQSELINITKTGEIILASGALGTPAILQRSGIGPRDHLLGMGIHPIVCNDEVGHGVDHMEVPVSYKWLSHFGDINGGVPRGGPMGWPIILFAKNEDDRVFMAHFGISPPPYGGGNVTATPNCTTPDPKEGFRVYLKSTDPSVPASLVHEPCESDLEQIEKGVQRTISLFETLRTHGIVGDRMEPPPEINGREAMREWMKTNIGTVYHWMSTCKANISPNSVADNNFIVRDGETRVIKNLRIGSGASLPEIPEANPHLTISAFSIALSHKVFHEQLVRRGLPLVLPSSLIKSLSEPTLSIRRFDEIVPDMWNTILSKKQ